MVVCTSCGFMMEISNIEYVSYVNKKCHERCVSHESKVNVLLEEYIDFLKKKWSAEHVEKVLFEIQNKLTTTYSSKQYRNSMIFTIVLKYASQNGISCNFKEHQMLLSLKTRVVNKALQDLRVGFISEGMCDEGVKKFVEKHGDTGIVRPKTLIKKGHKATQQIGSRIKLETKKTVKYDTTSTFLSSLMDAFFKNEKDIGLHAGKIHNVYLQLKKTDLYENEGETMCCLMSLFVVLQKNNLIKNTQDFCMKTRLSSVPTLRKLMKKYVTNEILSGF